jgi:hypothetical protein
MLSSGLKYEFGSLEESLTSLAIEHRSEVEYLKVLTIIAAINGVGKAITSAIGGQAYNGNDGLSDSLEALKSVMLPHFAEDKEEAASKAKKILEEEANRGILQIKVMERESGRGRRKG